jgi:hypothetical protein
MDASSESVAVFRENPLLFCKHFVMFEDEFAIDCANAHCYHRQDFTVSSLLLTGDLPRPWAFHTGCATLTVPLSIYAPVVACIAWIPGPRFSLGTFVAGLSGAAGLARRLNPPLPEKVLDVQFCSISWL